LPSCFEMRHIKLISELNWRARLLDLLLLLLLARAVVGAWCLAFLLSPASLIALHHLLLHLLHELLRIEIVLASFLLVHILLQHVLIEHVHLLLTILLAVELARTLFCLSRLGEVLVHWILLLTSKLILEIHHHIIILIVGIHVLLTLLKSVHLLLHTHV